MRRAAQQGDVLFKPVANLPEGCRVRPDGILARGEVTGHAHRLADATGGLLYEAPDGTLYLDAGAGGATITHEEHRPVHRPPGVDQIDIVREYDYDREEARRVAD